VIIRIYSPVEDFKALVKLLRQLHGSCRSTPSSEEPGYEAAAMTEPLPDDLAWTILDQMLLIRRFEEAVLRLSNEKQFVGHYHFYIWQEATGAPIMTLLDERDRIATTHRNHGHVLARGADPGRAMAEILGRAIGLNGGRGGTIHLSVRPRSASYPPQGLSEAASR
jgi:TPP-dependent pyruvate/acetoin dehydrogenase alpha subunit